MLWDSKNALTRCSTVFLDLIVFKSGSSINLPLQIVGNCRACILLQQQKANEADDKGNLETTVTTQGRTWQQLGWGQSKGVFSFSDLSHRGDSDTLSCISLPRCALEQSFSSFKSKILNTVFLSGLSWMAYPPTWLCYFTSSGDALSYLEYIVYRIPEESESQAVACVHGASTTA